MADRIVTVHVSVPAEIVGGDVPAQEAAQAVASYVARSTVGVVLRVGDATVRPLRVDLDSSRETPGG